MHLIIIMRIVVRPFVSIVCLITRIIVCPVTGMCFCVPTFARLILGPQQAAESMASHRLKRPEEIPWFRNQELDRLAVPAREAR
jgi:hypothetical protein